MKAFLLQPGFLSPYGTVGVDISYLIAAVATAGSAGGGNDDKVTICHRTSATSNPYGPKAIEVDASCRQGRQEVGVPDVKREQPPLGPHPRRNRRQRPEGRAAHRLRRSTRLTFRITRGQRPPHED